MSLPSGRVRRTAKAGRALAPAVVRPTDRSVERLVDTLGSMKGAAMKLGQLMAFVEVDFVPDEWRPLYQEKLSALLAGAPPEPWPVVEKVLREEWGQPVERVLADVEPVAAAAASVGQVHRARLHDGREVAVKVQYPGIAEAIRADLQNIGLITTLAKALTPHMEARAVAAEIRERVMEELDYELEAQNQRAFARAYAGNPYVHVPAVDTALSRRRVLVSEWIEGRTFEEVKSLDQAAKDRFGEIVNRFAYGSMHRLRVFNADPHPGNWILMADDRVAALDYGSCKRVAPDRLAAQTRFCLAASAGDAVAARQGLIDLGYLRPNTKASPDRVLESALAASWWIHTDREVTIDAEVVRGALAAMSDPRAGHWDTIRAGSLPAVDVLFFRLDMSVASILGQLEATRNWHRIAMEYWRGDPPATEIGRQFHPPVSPL